MRLNAHTKANLGRYILCISLIVVGFSAYAVSSILDVDYWTTQATTERGKIEWGAAAVIFQTMTFLFAGVVALLLREKKFMSATLATVVLGFFMAYGMSSVVGFGARERISKTVVATEQQAADAKAVIATNAESARLRNEHIDFLRSQVKKAPGPQSRQVALDALGQATFGTLEIKAEPVRSAMIDPQAEALNKLFPQWSVENIQFASTIAFGIGLILSKILCFAFGVALWPKAPEPRKEESVPVVDTLSKTEDARPSADIIRPEQFAKVKQPTAKADDPEEAAVEALATDLFGEVREHLSDVAGIEEFWNTQTRPAAAARISAKSFYQSYAGWAASKDLRPASAQMFGRVASRLGIDRDKTNPSQWAYVGRALVLDGDDAAIIMAA